jgi:hypothetical protein
VLAAAAAGAAGCNDGASGAGRAGPPAQGEGPTEVAAQAAKSPRSAEALVTIQRGGGVGDVFDTGIFDGVSLNNGSGSSPTIPVGAGGDPATASQELMRFDLSPITSLPAQRYNVVEAQVSLYFYPSSSDQSIAVHLATAPWNEGTASWPGFGESFVATPVTSFDTGPANPYDPTLFPPPAPNNVRLDATSLVSGWLNGAYPNDGIVLEQPPVPGVSTVVLTSDYPPALSGFHPTLFVEFTVTCLPGTLDCNADGLDGCETDITTPRNCGACGNACSAPNGVPACVAGACAVGACNAGFADCDGNPANGCETSLTTAADCGACGVPCALANAASSCASGACALTACNAGYFDCDGNPSNGCEPLPCGNGQRCGTGADCASGVCVGGTCSAPTCTDGVENGTETGVDCGGGSCPRCAPGQGCATAADCTSGVCAGGVCQAPTCTDGVENGAETGADCGGPSCPRCAAGGGCATGADCQSGVCAGGVCQAPACTDGVENGAETGVDCGGPSCPKCAAGGGCATGADCQSGTCVSGRCATPTCSDGLKNGTETGVDCGGGSCPKCGTGGGCNTGSDCASGVCSAVTHTCAAPTCTDGVKNGNETDVDCGGSCPACPIDDACATNADCQSGSCKGGVCNTTSCTDPLSFTVPHCTNVAPGHVMSASGAWPTDPIAAAVDGNCTTAWNAAGYAGWWQVDLGSVTSIRGVSLSVAGTPATTVNETISVSTDGVTFTNVYTTTVPDPATITAYAFDFGSNVNARYVRITESSPASWVDLFEVAIWHCN